MGSGVVITGIGVYSPVASGRDAFWDALFSGRTGFRPITLFDTAPFRIRMAGEITDFDPLSLLGKKGLRDLDRTTRLVCSASKLALDDSGLVMDDETSETTGVSIGATFGSLHSISQFDRISLTEGPRAVNPSHFPNTVINSPASQVSIRFKIRGFNTTISTGFCAGLDAVSYAADFIRLDRAKAVLAGGAEELCEETFLSFHHLRCLSGTDGAEQICCPFDARRNGTILSEGAAVLLLEDALNASERGAPVLARIAGYGSAFCTLPSPDAGSGLAGAIQHALNESGLIPEQIDCIFASANSSKNLDFMETSAIKQVFGSHAFRIPVTAIKSMIGETYSASGALALAAAVGTIRKGLLPPTVNYREKDPACDLDVRGDARHIKAERVLVIASDPYGQNTALILAN